MNLPLNFDTAEPWQTIVKIALMIAAVYTIAVISLFLKGNLLGGSLLVLFGLAFYAMLRRARRISMGAKGRLTRDGVTVHPVRVWGFSLNMPSGEFALDRFAAVGVVERILIGLPNRTSQSDSGTVQLMGRPGTPNIEVMIGDIEAAQAFAEELSAALNLELKDVPVPGQTIRRYTV
ncbi:MAG: hypothetical protein DMD66_01940 [Gemmatimonadetes bacterium]|nr:MAG: hypothetical protein DMD66_01940 [Gemmatimonadota bacterium]